MAKASPDQPESVSKREFLEAAAAIGGVSAMMTGLSGCGLGFASTAETPPDLRAARNGTSVLILGSGLSGMTAAYELGLRGYDCRILEARPFAGGRCQSARSGFTTTEMDGSTRTCEFDEGQYFNHGPWRLPSFHYALFHYVANSAFPWKSWCRRTTTGTCSLTMLTDHWADGAFARAKSRRICAATPPSYWQKLRIRARSMLR